MCSNVRKREGGNKQTNKLKDGGNMTQRAKDISPNCTDLDSRILNKAINRRNKGS